MLVRRTAATIGAALGLGLFSLPGSTAAVAAPYTCKPQLFLDTADGHAAGTVVTRGTCFGSLGFIQIDIHSEVRTLAATMTDGSGTFTRAVVIPAGFSCEHTITATNTRTGEVASADLMVQPCNRAVRATEPGRNGKVVATASDDRAAGSRAASGRAASGGFADSIDKPASRTAPEMSAIVPADAAHTTAPAESFPANGHTAAAGVALLGVGLVGGTVVLRTRRRTR